MVAETLPLGTHVPTQPSPWGGLMWVRVLVAPSAWPNKAGNRCSKPQTHQSPESPPQGTHWLPTSSLTGGLGVWGPD